MERIVLHTRVFSEELQKQIASDLRSRGCIWRDFDSNEFIKRELDMGKSIVNKRLYDDRLKDYVKFEIEPFTYEITFYYVVTHNEDELSLY